jgi:hypothetical protein
LRNAAGRGLSDDSDVDVVLLGDETGGFALSRSSHDTEVDPAAMVIGDVDRERTPDVAAANGGESMASEL